MLDALRSLTLNGRPLFAAWCARTAGAILLD
jgi:hypothetical protein